MTCATSPLMAYRLFMLIHRTSLTTFNRLVELTGPIPQAHDQRFELVTAGSPVEVWKMGQPISVRHAPWSSVSRGPTW